jgi:hypothetical protein
VEEILKPRGVKAESAIIYIKRDCIGMMALMSSEILDRWERKEITQKGYFCALAKMFPRFYTFPLENIKNNHELSRHPNRRKISGDSKRRC